MAGQFNVLWVLHSREQSDSAYHRGADISLLSQFTNEEEVLFPPCCMMIVERPPLVAPPDVPRGTVPPLAASLETLPPSRSQSTPSRSLSERPRARGRGLADDGGAASHREPSERPPRDSSPERASSEECPPSPEVPSMAVAAAAAATPPPPPDAATEPEPEDAVRKLYSQSRERDGKRFVTLHVLPCFV